MNRIVHLGVEGAVTIAINTDKQHLDHTRAMQKLLVGRHITRGLGAGGMPETGRRCAEAGRDVISIGKVPTPALYFAVKNSGTMNGVMVTGSHNEANYNGLKIVIGGKTLLEEDLQEIRRILDEGSFSSGRGSVMELDIMTVSYTHLTLPTSDLV